MNIIDEKKEGLKEYFESIAAYSGYLLCSINQDETAKNISKYNLKSALLSMITFNLIYNKENIIENKGSMKYEPKLYNFILDEYMSLIAPGKFKTYGLGNYETDSSEEMFAYIRNKFAHGDYYIDGDDVVLNHENSLPRININLLATFNIALSRSLIDGYKNPRYERQIICNKVQLLNTDNIYNADINDLLRLTIFKKITLTHKKNEIINSKIKAQLEYDIEYLKDVWTTLDKANIKLEEQKLVDFYDKFDCVLVFENKKIKDPEKIQKIKTALKSLKVDLQNIDIRVQAYTYGSIVHDIMIDNYDSDSIWMGAIYNQQILTEMITNNQYDYKKILTNSGSISMAQSSAIQLISSFLAQFCVLYLYPLDDIYKINNEYKFDRKDELDFSKLNMDSFKPTVYNFKNTHLLIQEQKVNSLERKINSLKDRIEQKVNSLEIINNKAMDNNEKQKIISKIEPLITELKQSLQELRREYLIELRQNCRMMADYEVNEKYFRNRNMIEGIRNSIAHGNVKIINEAECNFIGDIFLNFKDYDNGELIMDLTIKVSDFELLLKNENYKVITDFLNNKVKVNKFKY